VASAQLGGWASAAERSLIRPGPSPPGGTTDRLLAQVRISGPSRREWISQHWLPGSHTLPACRIRDSRGHRTAIMRRPGAVNSQGPICRGMTGSLIGPAMLL
jgi:hypothetical protein